MKILFLFSLFVFSCQRSEDTKSTSKFETIERQEEHDRNDLRKKDEQIPVDSSDEMDYYRDVVNEGELDN